MNYFNGSVNEIGVRGASMGNFSCMLYVLSSAFGIWWDGMGACILLKLWRVRGSD